MRKLVEKVQQGESMVEVLDRLLIRGESRPLKAYLRVLLQGDPSAIEHWRAQCNVEYGWERVEALRELLGIDQEEASMQTLYGVKTEQETATVDRRELVYALHDALAHIEKHPFGRGKRFWDTELSKERTALAHARIGDKIALWVTKVIEG